MRSDKCHAINFSRGMADCDFHFSVNGGIIEWRTKIKFLDFFGGRGLLSFRKHVEYLRKKCFKRINILKARALKSFSAR